jgi:DNA-binding response OmpR family regulator
MENSSSNDKRPFILSIDDDKDFNALLEKLLTRRGFRVETTSRPDAFLIRLKQVKPDLCIIDINLDKMTGAGFQLIQAIRSKENLNLPLIVLSRRNNKQDVSQALELGADDYISKPIDELVLYNKINNILRGHYPGKFLSDGPGVLSLPFKKVSPLIKKASIDFELGLETISEFGITLIGKHFLARNTRIILEHEILSKITGREQVILTVSKNWIDHDRNTCGSELLFDQEDGRLLTNVRQWLAQSNGA